MSSNSFVRRAPRARSLAISVDPETSWGKLAAKLKGRALTGSQPAYSSLEFHFALQRANDLSQLAHYRNPLSLISCLEGLDPSRAHRARLSRVVTATLLSEVAEVVALPDCRSEVPEDRVRNRDVEEEVG